VRPEPPIPGQRGDSDVSVYGTGVVKRLSKTQAHQLDTALLAMAAAEWPTSVRGMYYMAMGAGLGPTREDAWRGEGA
jgi:hypothetical protein